MDLRAGRRAAAGAGSPLGHGARVRHARGEVAGAGLGLAARAECKIEGEVIPDAVGELVARSGRRLGCRAAAGAGGPLRHHAAVRHHDARRNCTLAGLSLASEAQG